MGRGSTWRSNENGRHDLNDEFESMPLIKDWQLSVMFPLNPWSKGEGNGLAASVVAATMLVDIDDVLVADRDDEVIVVIDVADDTTEEMAWSDADEEELCPRL